PGDKKLCFKEKNRCDGKVYYFQVKFFINSISIKNREVE
ncbi:unnamed protein product, partial [marine sediment metagenome]